MHNNWTVRAEVAQGTAQPVHSPSVVPMPRVAKAAHRLV